MTIKLSLMSIKLSLMIIKLSVINLKMVSQQNIDVKKNQNTENKLNLNRTTFTLWQT